MFKMGRKFNGYTLKTHFSNTVVISGEREITYPRLFAGIEMFFASVTFVTLLDKTRSILYPERNPVFDIINGSFN
jgi:hypothetical protein